MIYKDTLREFAGNDDGDFYNLPVNAKAREDFKYLCSTTNFHVAVNVHNFTLTKRSRIGDFFVVGYDVQSNVCAVPQKYVNTENQELFVAVVIYQNKDVKDILIIPANEFGKFKLFGALKISKDKEGGNFVIHLGDASNKNLKHYSFGSTINSI